MTDPEIPGFKITREIGSGPRGCVYEASDGRRTLAVKVFRPDAPVDPALLERFLKTSPNRIRHPNLLPLESMGRTADGRMYVSMALLVGDSLENILEELRRGNTNRPSLSPLAVGPGGAMHPRLAWRSAELFAGAAEGLGAAHRRGAIHGRICARNLHLSPIDIASPSLVKSHLDQDARLLSRVKNCGPQPVNTLKPV